MVSTRFAVLGSWTLLSGCDGPSQGEPPGDTADSAPAAEEVDCEDWLDRQGPFDLALYFGPEGYLYDAGALFPTEGDANLWVSDESFHTPGVVQTMLTAEAALIDVAPVHGDACSFTAVAGTMAVAGELADCAEGIGCKSGSVTVTFAGLTFASGAYLDGASWTAAAYEPE